MSSCSSCLPCSIPRSSLKKLRMKERAALGSDAGRKGKRRKGISSAIDWMSAISILRDQLLGLPLDLISLVQLLRSSWTSSGSTSFRSQASAQRSFGGGGGALPLSWACFLFFAVAPAPSLFRKREKKGMFGQRVGVCSINQELVDHASKRYGACRWKHCLQIRWPRKLKRCVCE